LQLKKQQLQLEILDQYSLLEEKKQLLAAKEKSALSWAGLLVEDSVGLGKIIFPKNVITIEKNVAGTDIPVFERAEFEKPVYDLFTVPLWIDAALDALRACILLREEIKIIEKGIAILRQELRITTQRVNLFEKIKIPEAEEAIRLIKVYIGDQMVNAVGRSKIAKAKIEENMFEEALR
jgi:V/A-type H+-transporting ATPase subunit D